MVGYPVHQGSQPLVEKNFGNIAHARDPRARLPNCPPATEPVGRSAAAHGDPWRSHSISPQERYSTAYPWLCSVHTHPLTSPLGATNGVRAGEAPLSRACAADGRQAAIPISITRASWATKPLVAGHVLLSGAPRSILAIRGLGPSRPAAVSVDFLPCVSSAARSRDHTSVLEAERSPRAEDLERVKTQPDCRVDRTPGQPAPPTGPRCMGRRN